ncbi:MAG: helix-turn-helix domain-containing protein [Alphaproteobacteria bacterium]
MTTAYSTRYDNYITFLEGNMYHTVDLHVGKQLKHLRTEKEISRKILAQKLGISYQQVQKYEKGINRIPASRLYQIAQFLQTSMQDFFPPMEK